MSYIINALVLLGFVGLFNFFALWIPVLFIRNAIKKELKETDYEKYDQVFARDLLHQSISTSKREESFFKRKDWPDINSGDVKRSLRTQKRLEWIAKWSFIGFIICYVLVMILSTIFNR
ncbi:hypothetical protein CWE14_04760 [Aliidiomarina soli]|uniref:Uncharacterized protein n=1 Tax=Aliidiomarina soli TaxID=1928574 RepID=A0A432WIZ8_9GAMM|nr:hypothetical protein CWE14_04760 [Aliidiomarina soli]